MQLSHSKRESRLVSSGENLLDQPGWFRHEEQDVDGLPGIRAAVIDIGVIQPDAEEPGADLAGLKLHYPAFGRG